MKKLSTTAALALIVATATFAANAQTRPNSWYGKVDLGGSWVDDSNLESLFGPVQGDTTVEFDPGARLGLGAGYNFCEWFSLGAEIGMNWNEVNKLGEATQLDAVFLQMPLFVNATFELPNPTIVRPYVGAGVGGASTVMDINHLQYGDVRISGSASDFTFAWQAFAGLRFLLNENMSLGAEYRYVWSDAPSFEIDWGWYHAYDDHMALDDIQTHSISVVFNVEF